MKILVAIAHFFNPEGSGKHGSQRKDPRPRIQALSSSILSLHQTYSLSQCMIDIGQRRAIEANQTQSHDLDIFICTTGEFHLLNQLPISAHFYKQYATQCEPMLLGFECQALLRDNLGKYDYFCFLEDDLILTDPWFFNKINWFTKLTGDINLLQPNRYEASAVGLVRKAYIDGDLLPRVTINFQNVNEQPQLMGKVMETPINFKRALNPHSGCYFLNANQMEYWSKQDYFLDRDTSFVGPLESAATLGIMKTFRIYKPAPENAAFLEIQHFGSAFLSLIGGQVKLGD